MKTYSEKLKDPRWLEFREYVKLHLGPYCTQCGRDYAREDRGLHVHHKRYIDGREPWEYHIKDLDLLCGSCHAGIHECEQKWRNLIRKMPEWALTELSQLGDELRDLEPHDFKLSAILMRRANAQRKGGYR